jgi:hypothetical protein
MNAACCIPHPPLNAHGEDTTSFLQACRARSIEDHRWIEFCYLIGKDHCGQCLKENLMPLIGARLTGNS